MLGIVDTSKFHYRVEIDLSSISEIISPKSASSKKRKRRHQKLWMYWFFNWEIYLMRPMGLPL